MSSTITENTNRIEKLKGKVNNLEARLDAGKTVRDNRARSALVAVVQTLVAEMRGEIDVIKAADILEQLVAGLKPGTSSQNALRADVEGLGETVRDMAEALNVWEWYGVHRAAYQHIVRRNGEYAIHDIRTYTYVTGCYDTPYGAVKELCDMMSTEKEEEVDKDGMMFADEVGVI